MIKFVSKQKQEQIDEAMRTQQKLMQCHRWLAEFDYFLEPLWGHLFLNDPPQIDAARDKMRERFNGRA